ncbi:hypothetical protein RNT98_10120 [Staphylococcus pseudintermedius]|uniref:hypothetical protein n=2 Tax=Staphylococcus pseudintermedius TaxID=283734 RepID=UPI002887CF70|nr:hypothetical protein [Staphylococcus pseudintermedius]MDT0955183.1 hypothetical protein [Staphylococcus pseudintermedius]
MYFIRILHLIIEEEVDYLQTIVLNVLNLGDGNRIKQGDKSVMRYQLIDENDELSIVGKVEVVYLYKSSKIIYKKETTVENIDDKDVVIVKIDDILPRGTYMLEIVVDDKYVFPSDESEKIEVTKSILGRTFE